MKFFKIKNFIVAFVVIFFLYPIFTYAVDGEVTYTGTNTNLVGDDSSAGPFNLGFTFSFYNQNFTQAFVNINGTLNFGAGYSAYSNGALNSAGANNSIYPFWDDLITDPSYNQKPIYYATIGTAPNRMFVVQWTNVYFFSTTVQMGTFQAILYEGTNNIRIQYRDLLGGDRALGNSATIGIKKDATTFKQYSSNIVSLTQGQSILYTWDGEDYVQNSEADYELVYLAPEGAPTSPTLVNPTDGTTGVTLTPTFEWLPVDSATSYTVLISKVSNFSSTVVNQSGIAGTSYTLQSPLDENTNYYWRVQAVNSNGSSLSPTRSFVTGSTNTAPNTPASVSSSKLLGGVSNTSISGATLSATLSDPDDGALVRYRLQIATDSSFNSLVIDYRSTFIDQGQVTYTFGQSGGTYLVGNSETTLDSGDYYLRIRAEDEPAASSAWYSPEGVSFSVEEDGDAPTLSSISSSPELNSVTILWETNEPASSKIDYGPSINYSSSTPTTNTSPMVTEHSVTIPNLSSCILYNFRIRSSDANNNEALSQNLTFITKGCTGLAPVITQIATSAPTTTTTTLTLNEPDTNLTLSIPQEFSTTSANFQIKKIDSNRVIASTTPPSGLQLVGSHTYTLHAVTDEFVVIREFDNNITITLGYSGNEVSQIDEDSLKIYRWNEDLEEWVALANCVVDKSAKTVTCDTDHFSTFSLFGNPIVQNDTVQSRGSGSSIRSRVNNLLQIGSYDIAFALIKDWPFLFSSNFIEQTIEEKIVLGDSITVEEADNKKIIGRFSNSISDNEMKIDYGNRDLYTGLIGPDVLELQEFLGELNLGPEAKKLKEDGYSGFFGPLTKSALIEFQIIKGINPVSGYFGKITRNQLIEIGED